MTDSWLIERLAKKRRDWYKSVLGASDIKPDVSDELYSTGIEIDVFGVADMRPYAALLTNGISNLSFDLGSGHSSAPGLEIMMASPLIEHRRYKVLHLLAYAILNYGVCVDYGQAFKFTIEADDGSVYESAVGFHEPSFIMGGRSSFCLDGHQVCILQAGMENGDSLMDALNGALRYRSIFCCKTRLGESRSKEKGWRLLP